MSRGWTQTPLGLTFVADEEQAERVAAWTGASTSATDSATLRAMTTDAPAPAAQSAHMPFLGRCESCDFALFTTAEMMQPAQSFRDMARPGVLYRLNDGGYFARCANGHKVFRMRQIEGTYSESHKCDSRCLNAKGHTCTCSCGGANHGRGYAVNAMPVANPEGAHLGEVGKHIVGNVVVAGRREDVGRYHSTLYTFLTESGATITWWCPPAHDPHFEQGKRFKMRAKVTRHDDDQRFGKVTVVTYVEEKN